jgi:hypothetical protein
MEATETGGDSEGGGGLFDGLGPAPVEAGADQRMAGATMAQLYLGYLGAGFEPEQAMYLLGQILNGYAMGSAIAEATLRAHGEGSES